MSSDWVTLAASMGAGLVGAGAALAGVQRTLKSETERLREQQEHQIRSEHSRWTRDRRAEIYSRVLVLHARLLLDRPERFADNPDQAAAVAERNTAHVRDLMDSISELQVFGSRQINLLADEVGREIVRAGHADESRIEPRWQALATAIREDLGVPD